MTNPPSNSTGISSGKAPLVPPVGWMEIGSIVGAQGIKGEVKVYPNSDFPERFERAGERWLWGTEDLEPRSIQLKRGFEIPGRNLYVVQLEGINNRSQAENLRGHMLLLPTTDRPKLATGEYHSQDLLGLPVFHQTAGVEIGIVTDIFTAGHEVLVVSVADRDGPGPSHMRRKRIDPARLAHQSHAGGAPNGEQRPAYPSRERHEQPLSFGHRWIHLQHGEHDRHIVDDR